MQKHSARNWSVMEEDMGVSHTYALWNTGWHAKKVSHCNKTDGNPTVKLYIYIFKLYSSYIKIKINWITLQWRQIGMSQLVSAVNTDLITSIYWLQH